MNIDGAENDGWAGQRGARAEDQRRLHANTPHQNKARHSRAARSVPSSYVEIVPTCRRPTKDAPPFSAGTLRQSESTWCRRKLARPSNYEEGRRETKAQTPWLVQVPGRPTGRSYSDLSFAFPTARGSDNHVPSDKYPCHRVRSLDAVNNTGYLNLDANDPYAVAHAYQRPNNRFRANPATNLCHPHRRPNRRGALHVSLYPRRDLLDANFWRESGSGNGDGVHPTSPNGATSPRNGLEKTSGRPAPAHGCRTSAGSMSCPEQETRHPAVTPDVVEQL